MTGGHPDQQGPETGAAPKGRVRSRRKGWGALEFLVTLLVSFALIFGVVEPFVVEDYKIPSESMVPTLEIEDRLFVNKFIYRFIDPERGDIVVFKSVEGGEEDLIKRVVAVPGDMVEVRDGELYVNGQTQEGSYVNREFPDRSYYGPNTVPEGHVFVMGDNRANSRDSRFFGPVPYENIEGEAFLLFWPPDRIGTL